MTVRGLRKACQDAEITALLQVSFRLERMRPRQSWGTAFESTRKRGGRA